jgi:hypothetical protein
VARASSPRPPARRRLESLRHTKEARRLAGFLFVQAPMTDFEDRVRRMAREAMTEIGRDPSEIADVVEPPGADYCVIAFAAEGVKPIEVSKPLGAGESQELDEIRRALQYRFRT